MGSGAEKKTKGRKPRKGGTEEEKKNFVLGLSLLLDGKGVKGRHEGSGRA